jgi:hypothetical protein
MKERSYTAVERPVHHITVLDFDGDVIRGKVVAISGDVIDQYEITKGRTPPEEFCAYEVYELERAIRREIESRPPVIVAPHAKSATLRGELQVPHQFRVPVRARIAWNDTESSETNDSTIRLVPGEPLTIPLAHEVSLDCLFSNTEPEAVRRIPRMQLQFLDTRFRNRNIEFGPIKVWRDLTVRAVSLADSPTVGQLLDGNAIADDHLTLIHSNGTQAARVPVQVQMAAAGDRLISVITVHCTQINPVLQQEAKTHSNPTDVVKAEHVRLLLSNGTHSNSFVVGIDGRCAGSRDGDWSFDQPDWSAHIRRQSDACTIAMILPRKLVEGSQELRFNVVHADPAREIESCLSPTFDPGTDPDRVPDFRFGDRSVSRFARLVIE